MDAHLFLDGRAADPIACTGLAVRIRQELGHDEHGDALGAPRSIGQACKHEMDDVVGEIVLAGGNEDLGARDPEAAVRVGLGFRPHQADVGTTVRLREAHGARPVAGEKRPQPRLLLLWRAMCFERIDGAMGERRVHAPGDIGRGGEFLDKRAHARRQALATVVRVAGHRRPAAFDVGSISLSETSGRRYHPVLVATAFGITRRIQRLKFLLREPADFLEDTVEQIRGDRLDPRQALVMRAEVEDIVHKKAHVAQRRTIGGHVRNPVAIRAREYSPGAGAVGSARVNRSKFLAEA